MRCKIITDIDPLATHTRSSVEILPGDGKEWLLSQPSAFDRPDDSKEFILIEGNLGVPQKILCKAYLEAIPVFTRYKQELAPCTITVESTSSEVVDNLLWTSSVLILLNPGHQTAWNVRKRLAELQAVNLTQELSFTSALLTIRDCAKHSLLWHHRRWLLRQRSSVSLNIPSRPRTCEEEPAHDEDSLVQLDLSATILQGEFDACTTAANTYERNYFAWAHRSRCLDALATSMRTSRTSGSPIPPDLLPELLRQEAEKVALWIERHIADYSAMQYHCRLAFVFRSLSAGDTLPLPTSPSCYLHATSLVNSYPEHESLWYYLRGALWAGAASSSAHTHSDELKDLCNRHLRSKEASEVQSRGTLRLASNFLAWLNRQD